MVVERSAVDWLQQGLSDVRVRPWRLHALAWQDPRHHQRLSSELFGRLNYESWFRVVV